MHQTHAMGPIHAASLAGLFTYYNCESVQPHTPPLRVQAENVKSWDAQLWIVYFRVINSFSSPHYRVMPHHCIYS